MSIPSNLLNTITLGDSLELLKTLPDNSIDLILTDPPYGIGAANAKGPRIFSQSTEKTS